MSIENRRNKVPMTEDEIRADKAKKAQQRAEQKAREESSASTDTPSSGRRKAKPVQSRSRSVFSTSNNVGRGKRSR